MIIGVSHEFRFEGNENERREFQEDLPSKCRVSNSRDQRISYGNTFCFNIRNLSFNDYQIASCFESRETCEI